MSSRERQKPKVAKAKVPAVRKKGTQVRYVAQSRKSAWPEIIPDDLVKDAENNQYLNGTAVHPLAYVETPVVKKQQDELHRRSLDPSDPAYRDRDEQLMAYRLKHEPHKWQESDEARMKRLAREADEVAQHVALEKRRNAAEPSKQPKRQSGRRAGDRKREESPTNDSAGSS